MSEPREGMSHDHQPPFTLTTAILALAAEIGESVGRLTARTGVPFPPALRRENRLRTIQASLAIENNSLSLEQVTAVLAGKRVLGPPKEIQEVRNAFVAYEAMERWNPSSAKDLLAAHGLLMRGLVDRLGRYRTGGVGIAQGRQVVHIAPPAGRVPDLMKDLLAWLKRTDLHPLIASCVFHYELEFIHPFEDGNGRMGRLWQTLVLSRWKPLLAWLPVETVIRERQAGYYAALAASDASGSSTPFIEFLLLALRQSLDETAASDQVSDQVRALLGQLTEGPASALVCMERLGLSHRPTFRKNYLQPALEAGLIERTLPDTPNSPRQQYRLSHGGVRILQAKTPLT